MPPRTVRIARVMATATATCYDLFMSWDPLRELQFGRSGSSGWRRISRNAWAPPIDVYETPTTYVVTAEVPGLARERSSSRWRTRG